MHIEDSSAVPSQMAALSIRINGGEPTLTEVPIGQNVNLPITLKHGGPSVFELDVTPSQNELTQANNRAVISINGVRDRLRVAGRAHR